MLSKELLKAVFKEDFSSSKIEFEQHQGQDTAKMVIDDWLTINTYELAHKCKEWAVSKGYFINSSFGKYEDGIKCFATFNYEAENIPSSFILEEWFKADTEPEAIFKACEWILKQEDLK